METKIYNGIPVFYETEGDFINACEFYDQDLAFQNSMGDNLDYVIEIHSRKLIFYKHEKGHYSIVYESAMYCTENLDVAYELCDLLGDEEPEYYNGIGFFALAEDVPLVTDFINTLDIDQLSKISNLTVFLKDIVYWDEEKSNYVVHNSPGTYFDCLITAFTFIEENK